jgi:hypothetical protein
MPARMLQAAAAAKLSRMSAHVHGAPRSAISILKSFFSCAPAFFRFPPDKLSERIPETKL